jgi:hypothetical protein
MSNLIHTHGTTGSHWCESHLVAMVTIFSVFYVRCSPRQKKQMSIEHMHYTTQLNQSAAGCSDVFKNNSN